MTCKRCRVAMKMLRGVHHNQRKFQCPRCGRVAMQLNKPKDRGR
jgi:hypothetical protein